MILAVDPGLNCGWAVVALRPVHVVDLGALAPVANPAIDRGTDRARRVARIATQLEATARGHGCTMIAAESLLGFGTVHAVIPQALVWGALTQLATTLDIDLAELRAREWQHEIMPELDGRKMNYAVLAKKLTRYIGPRIARIESELRTHALDAVGIGLCAALRPVTLVHRGRARRERDQECAEGTP